MAFEDYAFRGVAILFLIAVYTVFARALFDLFLSRIKIKISYLRPKSQATSSSLGEK